MREGATAQSAIADKVTRPPTLDTQDVPPHPADLHAQLLFQQRRVGNRAVQRLISSGAPHAVLGMAPRIQHHASEKPPEESVDPDSEQRDQEGGERTSEPIQLQHAGDSPTVQRDEDHWYNFSIPGTDYQFDPSIEGVKTAAGVVADTAESAFDYVVDEIKSLVSEGKKWLQSQWDSIQEFASSAFTSAQDFFGAIVSFVTSPLGALANAIMSLDGETVAQAWTSFSELVSSVSTQFKKVTDGLLEGVNSVWSRINTYATGLLERVTGLTRNPVFSHLPDALQRAALSVIEELKSLWDGINDTWNRLVARIKGWIESALETVFGFVRRVASFGINVVIDGIVQFGRLVLFMKDLFSNPQKYVAILAEKSVQAFDGVEDRFAGIIAEYFGNASGPQPAAATVNVQRQPAQGAAAPASEKGSATWSEIGTGIWEVMGNKWAEFKANPMSVVLGLLLDMVLPIVGNIKDIIHLFDSIKKIVTGPLSAGSLEELWTSLLIILDIPILIYNTVVSILMRSLMLPLIVASFIPHPVVKGIAAAVGYALLGAFLQAEALNVGQKLLLLKTGLTTKDQKTDAYNSIADSFIAVIMAAVIAVIMLLLHFLANVAKGIYTFLKGKVFQVEPRPVETRPTDTAGDTKGRGGPEESKGTEGRSGEEVPSEDGQRKLKLNEEGRCEVCASPCDEIRKKYADELTQRIDSEIGTIEGDGTLSDAQKRTALRPLEQQLADLREVSDWEARREISPEHAAELKAGLDSRNPTERAAARQEMKKLRTEIEAEEEFGERPRDQRISDANKAELQESGWLRERLPNVEHRRNFMKWLERGHQQGEAHEHLRPGTPEAQRALQQWSEETGIPLAR